MVLRCASFLNCFKAHFPGERMVKKLGFMVWGLMSRV